MIDESHFGALGELLVVLQDSHKKQEEQIINASALLGKTATDFQEIKNANESIRKNLETQHELVEKFMDTQDAACEKIDKNVSEIVSKTALRIRLRYINLVAGFIVALSIITAAVCGIYSWKSVDEYFTQKYNMNYQKYDKWLSIMKDWEDKGCVITYDQISFPEKHVKSSYQGTLDGKSYQCISLKN